MVVFQLRKAFRNILRTLPDVVHILALFLASIAIFALLALKLMQNRSEFSASLCSDVAAIIWWLLSVLLPAIWCMAEKTNQQICFPQISVPLDLCLLCIVP